MIRRQLKVMLGTVATTLFFGLVPAYATLITLNAVNSGTYWQDGTHLTDNYAVGWYDGGSSPPNVELRDYFVFDLSSVSGTIVSANLHLSTAPPGFIIYGSNDPSETYTLFDVSTSLSTLTAGSGGVSAFNDLGTGTSFGGVTVDSSLGSTVDVPFNAAGIGFLQGQSGQFVVGGAITTLAKGSSDEFLFNATNASLTRQLVITTTPTAVPEPSTFLLVAAGTLVGLAFLRKGR